MQNESPHDRPIKVTQFGLGPIGMESLRLLAQKPWITIVGGIDIDPTKVGRPLAERGVGANVTAPKVFATFDEMWSSGARPDVVIHTAGSKAASAIEQIMPIARAGVSVVSSCEELLFPSLRAGDASRQLNIVCEASGARVVGTGVNPGFVMDVLPICLTGVSRTVEEIHMQRIVNASTRRMPLQKKIGSGLRPEEFRALFASGRAGHAGFQESIALVAHCLGWKLEQIEETCDPVIAEHDIRTDYFQVSRGRTCGLHQQARTVMAGKTRITMDLKMFLDAPDPHVSVQIVGDPPIDMRIAGGVAGDAATVAALINTIPRLLKAAPGLRLMTELALPSIA